MQVTLTARASETDEPIACSVDVGRAIQKAQAHVGVGGDTARQNYAQFGAP